MARVVETFNPKRNKVKSNNSEGKTENCSGSVIFIAVNKTNRANVILMISKILNNHVGSGIISIATIIITLTMTINSLAFIVFPP